MAGIGSEMAMNPMMRQETVNSHFEQIQTLHSHLVNLGSPAKNVEIELKSKGVCGLKGLDKFSKSYNFPVAEIKNI